MTLEDLASHSLFKALGASLRRFVLTYCKTDGDMDAATLTAYPNLHSKTAIRAYGKRSLDNYAVARLIAIWNGLDEDHPDLDRFKLILWDMLKNQEKGINKAAVADLLADVSGWKKSRAPLPSAPESSSFIDQLESK